MFFNSFLLHADTVQMANLAQIVKVIAPIFTNKEGLFPQPVYFPIAEYAKQRGNQSIDLWVSSLTYTAGRDPLPYLDTLATYQPATGTLYLNVLNRGEKLDIATRIDNVTGALDGAVEVWEVNHADLKATHTFGEDRAVCPTVRKWTATVRGNSTNYTFPKHSLTILKLRVR